MHPQAGRRGGARRRRGRSIAAPCSPPFRTSPTRCARSKGRCATLSRRRGRARPPPRTSLDIARRRLELGGTTYLGVLNAEQAHAQERASLAARAARYADTAALYQALGVGDRCRPRPAAAASELRPRRRSRPPRARRRAGAGAVRGRGPREQRRAERGDQQGEGGAEQSSLDDEHRGLRRIAVRRHGSPRVSSDKPDNIYITVRSFRSIGGRAWTACTPCASTAGSPASARSPAPPTTSNCRAPRSARPSRRSSSTSAPACSTAPRGA